MSRMAEQQLYINGGYTSATSGRTFETINPATGEVLATVQAAGREDVDRAVESAQRGQKIWAAMTAMERSRILRRAVDLLRQRNDELARLETLDTGKPLSETAAVDIVTGADVLEYYAGLIPALEGSQIPLRDSSFVYTRREPLGVVAGIGAWNYPIRDRPVEIGASAGRWQCDDFQTERSHPADRPQAGGNLQRSGPAGRGV